MGEGEIGRAGGGIELGNLFTSKFELFKMSIIG